MNWTMMNWTMLVVLGAIVLKLISTFYYSILRDRLSTDRTALDTISIGLDIPEEEMAAWMERQHLDEELAREILSNHIRNLINKNGVSHV